MPDTTVNHDLEGRAPSGPPIADRDPVLDPSGVKWSKGTERPKTPLPANACDCHHHIYDARYAYVQEAVMRPPDALVSDYRALQRRLGISRNVIVQPSSYGTDNRLLLESIRCFDGMARGVAVVHADVSDSVIQELHDGGVRGLRFNLVDKGATTLEMIEPLAARTAHWGWHVQVNAGASVIAEAEDVFTRLATPIVFDHLARIPHPDAGRHPAFRLVRTLLQRGKAYVKLSGFYNESLVGAPSYADAVELAQRYVIEAPERVLWGTDWPHPTEQPHRIPDDAALVNAFDEAVPSEACRQLILVDNPARLYQFG